MTELDSNSVLFASRAQILYFCTTFSHDCHFPDEDTEVHKEKELPWIIMEAMAVLGRNPVSLTFFPYSRAPP